jgi:hypothetical protein
MAPKRKLSRSRAKSHFDAVRLCFAQTFTKEELMRICKCGGVVSQHQLTNNREAWTCKSCGRYEIFEVNKPEPNRSEEDGKV